jgi:hypothetical protein
VPPLTHLPPVSWSPWMTPGALPYGLPPQQAAPTFAPPLLPPPLASWQPRMSSWSQQPLAHSFHTTMMVPPAVIDWVVDSDASNHITSSAGNLTSVRSPLPTDPSSIVVGNRSSLPVTSVGNTAFPRPFYLNNVLVTPDIIQNLLFVCRFTTDNWCSMEFDPYGLWHSYVSISQYSGIQYLAAYLSPTVSFDY